MDARLREGDDAQRPDGGESPGLPDGAADDPEFLAELRVLDDFIAERMAEHKRFYGKARERFIAGYPVYGHSWRDRDLESEVEEETIDAFLWGPAMRRMLQQRP